jgi:hypothetical protein
MAFCNKCGATVTDGTSFCNKCGAAIPAGPSVPGATAPTYTALPPSKGGSGALKIILIIVAVIVGIGVLGMVTCGIVIHRIAKNAHVSQNGDNVKVETPFGSVETNKDPAQAAKDLGVDIYPGAVAQKNGTASMTFGSMHTVTGTFETTDSGEKVCEFYKSKLPAGTTTSSDPNRCNIISGDPQNMITINVQPSGDATKFVIANVSKKTN